MSQSQVRYVHLLEMTTPEVDEELRREVSENPALEQDSPQETSPVMTDDNRPGLPHNLPVTTTRHEFFTPADTSQSLYDVLWNQAETLEVDNHTALAIHYIIGSLDTNGYLRRSLANIADDILFAEGVELSQQQMQKALNEVQHLDPPGVGAHDLQESLMLQLSRLPNSTARNDAIRIVTDEFDRLGLQHLDKIKRALRLDNDRMSAALSMIHRLNPKPGSRYISSSGEEYINPDFEIDVSAGEITITLAGRDRDAHLSTTFERALEQMRNKGQRDADCEFAATRFNEARDFISILQRRRRTLMDVMTAIVKLQREYILTGEERYLRPMGLKDIVVITGINLSVISRATKNKYVQLPGRIVPLRFFFSERFESRGQDTTDTIVSGREIEETIRTVIAGEDKQHPFSDETICNVLRNKGYNVSRRTINKYRDRLGIPVARLRKSR